MITVHHLENSRSQRVLWLLEELALPYDVRRYDRDPQTNLAPKALVDVHPLGKSPVVEEDGVAYAETGAIFDYLLERHGEGRLAPAHGSDEYRRFRYWIHAAEGSFMPPMVMSLFLQRMETAPMPFFARPIAKKMTQAVRDAYLDHTTEALFGFAQSELQSSTWIAGETFTAADIMISFPLEAAVQRSPIAQKMTVIKDYVARLQARPAYQAALKRGGPYAYA